MNQDWTAQDLQANDQSAGIGTLARAAAQPEIDPCDVACDAMPGLVFGDLVAVDERWVQDHTTTCNYCRQMLESFEQIDDLLDGLAVPAEAPEFVAPGCRAASYTVTDSPVGPLLVAVSDEGLCEVGFAGVEAENEIRAELRQRGFAPVRDDEKPRRAVRELQEYFSGNRNSFDMPLDLAGVAPFTQAVLRATAEVPYGSLSTYQEIARRIGKPGASRAVGNALGRNPIPVVIPCHRIIRSDATMGGYTGGLPIKQALLQLEGAALT